MQQALTDQIAERLLPLRETAGTFDLVAHDTFCPQWLGRPWIAITSSRLGHDPRLHREICGMVSRCLADCRRRNAVLVIATGSAIEPWAVRAAELFQVPLLRIAVDNDPAKPSEISLRLHGMSRDEAVVLIADRVDAVYVRRGGTIETSLQNRLAKRADATTRVAITSQTKCAGKDLIAKGAIGWLAQQVEVPMQQPDTPQLGTPQLGTPQPGTPQPDTLRHDPTKDQRSDDEWIHSEGEWLVHCTRSCIGPWPGQTEDQYRDSMLLGNPACSGRSASNRTPLDTLQRIIRSGKLIANAIASAKAWPVVCFSAVPLSDLLLSRCYRPHLKRWDYEPYGIAIRCQAAQQIGFLPVIYGDKQNRASISESDQFRFQATGKTYDWTAEREWRFAGDVDLQELDKCDVRVFVGTDADASQIADTTPWQISAVLEPPRNIAERV